MDHELSPLPSPTAAAPKRFRGLLRFSLRTLFIVFTVGCIFSLISGMLGMSTGMVAVAKHYRDFPDPLWALGEGLRELSNNGTFAVILAFILFVVGVVSKRGSSASA